MSDIHLVAAARPNFMKVAPLYRAMTHARLPFRPVLVHTGQHYDAEMSDAFLNDFGLPRPDISLGIGSGTHAEQTGRVMIAYEPIARERRPVLIVVVGDVNSTLACTLAAKKLCLPVAHLEAGLRSGDRSMPEEINRIVTDALADYLWTPSPDADANLLGEGVPEDRIRRVGNVMIDAFELVRDQIDARPLPHGLTLPDSGFAVVTLHRPSNVDRPEALLASVEALLAIAERLPVVFPVHPRTKRRLDEDGLLAPMDRHPHVSLLPPLGYVDFMALVTRARLVVTDSGGVQEETTYLGIPCLTLRSTTERPITVSEGTNRLVDPKGLVSSIDRILAGAHPPRRIPDLWDGRAADRIVAHLAELAEAGITQR